MLSYPMQLMTIGISGEQMQQGGTAFRMESVRCLNQYGKNSRHSNALAEIIVLYI